MAAVPSDAYIPLSTWSQTAPRDYISFALCFPFVTSLKEDARSHLDGSLRRLAIDRPEYAGRLKLSEDLRKPGQLNWVPDRQSPPTIMSSFDDISRQFVPYEELREDGFPPALFARPCFRLGLNPNPTDGTQGPIPPDFLQQPQKTGQGRDASFSTIPVAIVRAFVIQGGLILLAHLHHGFGDGDCMRAFLECLGAATRGQDEPRPANWSLKLPADLMAWPAANPVFSGSTEALAARCPEYTYIPGQQVGPTQPVLRPGGLPLSAVETAAKILIFGRRLPSLRRRLSWHGAPHEPPDSKVQEAADPARLPGDGQAGLPLSQPTTFVALAALTWSHITRARTRKEQAGVANGPAAVQDAVATISNPTNWKRRLQDEIAARCGAAAGSAVGGYCGNATAKCLTRVAVGQLMRGALAPAAERPFASSSSRPAGQEEGDGEAAWRSLADVARRITDSIDRVGGDFVASRTRLYASLPDPRSLGLADDPRVPHDMSFNTWRRLGAGVRFCLPGLGEATAASSSPSSSSAPLSTMRPDAIRKAMVSGKIDFRNVLILPGEADPSDYDSSGRCTAEHEVLICLPKVSLEALLEDQDFMYWVDRVIG